MFPNNPRLILGVQNAYQKYQVLHWPQNNPICPSFSPVRASPSRVELAWAARGYIQTERSPGVSQAFWVFDNCLWSCDWCKRTCPQPVCLKHWDASESRTESAV